MNTRAVTLARLGFGNLARVAAYRAALKLPLSGVRALRAQIPAPPFFTASPLPSSELSTTSAWGDKSLLFSHIETPISASPPDWQANPLSGQRVRNEAQPWWRIPDFDPAVGDIKGIWELSRFDWVPALAQRARNGDADALTRLNAWLADWLKDNPPYFGPNWKCGQEAAIRVMHLAMAHLVLAGTEQSTGGLCDLIEIHLRRIAPTTAYAIGQANNHGTSEAAALFIGGLWLRGAEHPFARRGRAMLEDRVAKLIRADGSFSQYSVNYHRLMLDTVCLAECWRASRDERPFSARFYRRVAAATEWLRRMTNAPDGDAPNIGANDGARLLQLDDGPFRDHRPTVQLASLLFLNGRAFPPGPWDGAARWLGASTDAAGLAEPTSHEGRDGGFAVLRRSNNFAVLRYPRFRFRPSHSDLLHLDLWVGGENLFRDGGTYSYAAEAGWLEYFSGVRSHNTVEFDNRDQMPRIGRFLFGGWPEGKIVDPLVEGSAHCNMTVAYRDLLGAGHERRVTLSDDRLEVCDHVSGFSSRAVLRWRLRPGKWRLDGSSLSDGGVRLTVESTVQPRRLELVQGWESRRYMEIVEIPVLEIEVEEPATLTTVCAW